MQRAADELPAAQVMNLRTAGLRDPGVGRLRWARRLYRSDLWTGHEGGEITAARACSLSAISSMDARGQRTA